MGGERAMSELVCKHCGSGSSVRNGMAPGHQRYRCKTCGRNFTATPPRGKPPAMKALAVLLYGLGNVSQGMIAKLLGVSHVAVYKWIKAAGEEAPAPSTTPEDNIVQIDEMWHFVNGKKTRFGSGEPSILWHGEPCNYPHLSTPNQRLAGFAQIVSLCAELFEGPPRQATLSGSNIDRSRNYNGPCGWSEMWVIARRSSSAPSASGWLPTRCTSPPSSPSWPM